VTTDSNSFDVIVNLMSGLTEYESNLTVKPACAKSYEVLDGGKRYLFHLRPDVYWSDGKRVVAGDFAYAWKRLLNPETAAQYAFFLYDLVNAQAYNEGKIKDANLVGVKALNDDTLEVRLTKPAAYFIYLTAFCPTFPERRDVIERFGDRWSEPEHIVTNGPFVLKRWEHEYKIELAANPHYFAGCPKLRAIKMFMIPEVSTAFALYENNELDFIDNRSVSTDDLERVEHSPEYHNFPLLRSNYVAFNVTKKPFDDAKVRKAFAMAIDRSVFPVILRRHERPIDSWIPPGLLGYSATSGPGYHPDQARKLLAEAGYENGANFPHVSMLYPTREDTQIVVEAIQDQLKRNLNVHIDLVNEEWKVYLSNLHMDAPPIFRGNWGADYPDPQTFMNIFTQGNGNNYTRWLSPAYDSLIAEAQSEQNKEKRGTLYQTADHMLCSVAVPIVPTYLSSQNLMVKPWVHGISCNALDLQFFEKVTVGN
jgi:oligopeptide transport system substrate-binding protein